MTEVVRARDAHAYREFVALFERYDIPAGEYLADHYQRFATTLDEFKSTWNDGSRVLDIGAHWLHQAVMWRLAGFDVTAVDMPSTFNAESVKNIAHAMTIPLLPCADLERAEELAAIPDNSVDIVLFTEILEHITFNPINLWRQVHRILAPRGRIVVTTPNYYSWKGRAWQLARYVTGKGGGISVEEILKTHTYGHHWREYSRREVLRYFQVLSPDFVPVKARLMPSYMRSAVRWKNVTQWTLDLLPLLRPNLHVEIAMPTKTNGIVVSASW
ncbi:class I SAM-dependent methyltransferase [Dyella humicola]|uniref:class I SAM-dependent methyltransferase n=1 Tax=Dyella humicola TaxID=2992126 RepID=UPI002259307B|nr:methyltransferase domain-containing protein [Dyella humicola]